MTSAGNHDAKAELPSLARRARTGYRILAWLFLAGIAVQVFFAGVGLFAGPHGWQQHKTFVHVLEALPILMLILASIGKLPVSMLWLTAATFGLIGVQYATIEIGLPTLAAFHPVNAILLFWLTLTLVHRISRPSEVQRVVGETVVSAP